MTAYHLVLTSDNPISYEVRLMPGGVAGMITLSNDAWLTFDEDGKQVGIFDMVGEAVRALRANKRPVE